MNVLSGFPGNITKELCNFLLCCCYQCFTENEGNCVGKLGLGQKGGRKYSEEKRQALYDGFNGVWMQIPEPAEGSDGWVFKPGMHVNTLFSKEAGSLHKSASGLKPLSGTKRSCEEAGLQPSSVVQRPSLSLDLPSITAAKAPLLVHSSSFTDDDFQHHVRIPIPHGTGESVASIFFRSEVFKLPCVIQHHTAGVFKRNKKSVSLVQWLQQPPIDVTTHSFAM